MDDAAGECRPSPAAERASYRTWAFDKLRYNDSDRQGHVNNAVFATFFETGRVSFLYDHRLKLMVPGCEFVVVHLAIDYHAELYYPGEVHIGTRILTIGRSSFRVGQGAFKDATCVATAESVIVQLNEETRRPEALSHQMRAWLGERLAT